MHSKIVFIGLVTWSWHINKYIGIAKVKIKTNKQINVLCEINKLYFEIIWLKLIQIHKTMEYKKNIVSMAKKNLWVKNKKKKWLLF